MANLLKTIKLYHFYFIFGVCEYNMFEQVNLVFLIRENNEMIKPNIDLLVFEQHPNARKKKLSSHKKIHMHLFDWNTFYYFYWTQVPNQWDWFVCVGVSIDGDIVQKISRSKSLANTKFFISFEFWWWAYFDYQNIFCLLP